VSQPAAPVPTGPPEQRPGGRRAPGPAVRSDDPAAIRRRETDPLKVVPPLDGARGYALVLVVMHHCWIAALNARLDDGVGRDLLASFFVAIDFFFVISGFVLFLPAVRDGNFGSVRAYFGRRIARIVPAYYVALAGLVLLYPAIAPAGSNNFWQRDHLEGLGIHVLFLQRELLGDLHGLYGFGSTLGFGVNGPLWSLSIEIIYYLVLPVVAILFLRRPFVALIGAIAIALAWRAASWHILPDLLPQDMSLVRRNNIVVGIAYQFPAMVGMLGLGMTLAWVYVKVLRSPEGGWLGRLRRHAGLLQIPALALLVTTMVISGSRDNRFLFTGPYFQYGRDQLPGLAFAVLILLAALSGRRGQWPWANRVGRWLGDVSYGAYLWHSLVLWFALWQFDWYPYTAGVAFDTWPFFRNTLFVLPVALFLGWASFRYVEQPAIRWMRDRLRRAPRVRAPAEPAPAKGG
jgi:peptidoglycan/LPS O-acetylase OafA/YrhL